MSKRKPNKSIKFRGISAKLPESYYKKLRADMLENDIKSVSAWVCNKIDGKV